MDTDQPTQASAASAVPSERSEGGSPSNSDPRQQGYVPVGDNPVPARSELEIGADGQPVVKPTDLVNCARSHLSPSEATQTVQGFWELGPWGSALTEAQITPTDVLCRLKTMITEDRPDIALRAMEYLDKRTRELLLIHGHLQEISREATTTLSDGTTVRESRASVQRLETAAEQTMRALEMGQQTTEVIDIHTLEEPDHGQTPTGSLHSSAGTEPQHQTTERGGEGPAGDAHAGRDQPPGHCRTEAHGPQGGTAGPGPGEEGGSSAGEDAGRQPGPGRTGHAQGPVTPTAAARPSADSSDQPEQPPGQWATGEGVRDGRAVIRRGDGDRYGHTPPTVDVPSGLCK